MILAILAGTKGQTRRIVKPQPNDPNNLRIVNEGRVHYTRPHGDSLIDEARATPGYQVLTCAEWLATKPCPYGRPGDRLWVRETWAVRGIAHGMKPSQAAKIASRDAWCYAADDATGWQHGWKPSIHMPRAASRITLEITDVRCERLQDISEADAVAEGAEAIEVGGEDGVSMSDFSHREGYAKLWDQIHGPGSWASNPWVWAITFKRVENANA